MEETQLSEAMKKHFETVVLKLVHCFETYETVNMGSIQKVAKEGTEKLFGRLFVCTR